MRRGGGSWRGRRRAGGGGDAVVEARAAVTVAVTVREAARSYDTCEGGGGERVDQVLRQNYPQVLRRVWRAVLGGAMR